MDDDEATNFAGQLRDWRRAVRMKQNALADYLGVTQSAVSRWESGLDAPNRATMRRIVDIMAGVARDDLAVERMALLGQSTVRAIFDVDGIRTVAISDGFLKLWPKFAQLQGMSLADILVGESAQLVGNAEFMRRVRRNEIAFVTGVSDLHVDFRDDPYSRHRWHIVARHIGPKTYVEMLYETCDPAAKVGVEKLVSMDEIGHWTPPPGKV
jgi:transcriptional regulator with XRE-family HTH domain